MAGDSWAWLRDGAGSAARADLRYGGGAPLWRLSNTLLRSAPARRPGISAAHLSANPAALPPPDPGGAPAPIARCDRSRIPLGLADPPALRRGPAASAQPDPLVLRVGARAGGAR